MTTDRSNELGGRLPLADRAALDPAQRALSDRLITRIVPWADDAEFRTTGADGRLIGPFNPALLNAGGAIWRADYELYAHVALARSAGLSEGAARRIAAGEEPAEPSNQETIAQRLTQQLSATYRADETLYRQAEDAFGAHGLIDIAFLIGIYHAVCATLTMFAIPAPGQAGHP